MDLPVYLFPDYPRVSRLRFGFTPNFCLLGVHDVRPGQPVGGRHRRVPCDGVESGVGRKGVLLLLGLGLGGPCFLGLLKRL